MTVPLVPVWMITTSPSRPAARSHSSCSAMPDAWTASSAHLDPQLTDRLRRGEHHRLADRDRGLEALAGERRRRNRRHRRFLARNGRHGGARRRNARRGGHRSGTVAGGACGERMWGRRVRPDSASVRHRRRAWRRRSGRQPWRRERGSVGRGGRRSDRPGRTGPPNTGPRRPATTRGCRVLVTRRKPSPKGVVAGVIAAGSGGEQRQRARMPAADSVT